MARFVDAPFDEVVQRAETRDLRGYFERSDKQPVPTPLAVSQRRGKDGHQAVVELLAKKEPPPPPKTGRQLQIEIMGRRWSAPRLTPAQTIIESYRSSDPREM